MVRGDNVCKDPDVTERARESKKTGVGRHEYGEVCRNQVVNFVTLLFGGYISMWKHFVLFLFLFKSADNAIKFEF